MSKKSYIAFLKMIEFTRVERNSYVDGYGLHLVFNDAEMHLSDRHHAELCISNFESEITTEIFKYRGSRQNPTA